MKKRSLFWWFFAVSFTLAGVGLSGLLVSMALFPESDLFRWIFGPLWFLGFPLLLGTTIVWLVARTRSRLWAKSTDSPVMVGSSPGRQLSPKKGLTPVQIGGGVGAAVTCLCILVVRDLSSPDTSTAAGDSGMPPNFILGISSGIGAMVAMAIVALVTVVRRRSRKVDRNENEELEK